MQYRQGIEHAPVNLAFAKGRAVTLKECAPMQYRQEIGHAPANLRLVAVLTSSFALLAFSKY